MKWFALFLFIPYFVIGQDTSAKEEVILFPVKKAIDSMVTVAVSAEPKQSQIDLSGFSQIGKSFLRRLFHLPPLMETIGFIAKDNNGNIGVIAGFNIPDRAVYIKMEKSLVVYNNKNRGFAVKEIRTLSPLNNLVFLKVEGDLTEQGKRPPLPLAKSQTDNKKLFYISRISSSGLWFKAKPVQTTVSLPDRQDFLIENTYTKAFQPAESVNTPLVNHTPVLNQKGEVVSFVFDGSQHTLYGIPLRGLKNFLSSSEICSPFIRGCVIEARRTLYKQALSRDRKAMYVLMSLTENSFKAFEMFMHSIGIKDSTQIKKEQDLFWREATKWNAGLYHHWLTNNEDLSKEERKKHLEFLESSIKSLAQQQDHPHFQYLLGDIYFHLGNRRESQYWLDAANKNGYPLSEQLNQGCEQAFTEYFMQGD